MNQVILVGKLSRDPEMRQLASGKNVTTFTLVTSDQPDIASAKAEYSPIVTWDRLAEICGTYLGKGQTIAITGSLQTRSWDDDTGRRYWKTEVVADHVEMLTGTRKKDFTTASSKEATDGA